MTEELLTEVEHEALRVSGHLWHLLNLVVGDGRTRNADLDELIVPIHFIQRYVMANAAARAYPGECRLLGGSIPRVVLLEVPEAGAMFRSNEIIGNGGGVDQVVVNGKPVEVEWRGPLEPDIAYVAVGCRRCLVAVIVRSDDADGAFAFGEQHQHGS